MAFDQLYQDVDDLDVQFLCSIGIWARRAGDAKIAERFKFRIESTGQTDYFHTQGPCDPCCIQNGRASPTGTDGQKSVAFAAVALDIP